MRSAKMINLPAAHIANIERAAEFSSNATSFLNR
jgi:hypothetical protein